MLKNGHLGRVFETINSIQNEEFQRRLLNALYESVNIHAGEENNKSKLVSPIELSKRYRVDLSQLMEYEVVIDYIQAVDFLESLNFRIQIRKKEKDKYKSFRNKYHGNRFKKVLGRKPDKFVNNIYTYAEIMYLVDQTQVFKQPKKL